MIKSSKPQLNLITKSNNNIGIVADSDYTRDVIALILRDRINQIAQENYELDSLVEILN